MILPKLRYPIRSWIFLGPITFQISILSPTIRTKFQLNGGTGLPNPGPILSRTRSGATANCWLLCLIYVCYLLNHIACTALAGKIPLFALTGITPDISIILLFTFYQPVFYATYDQHFPSESEERAGYWVGFGEHCGDAMTHKILDHDTQKIIYRSAVRPKKSSTPNHRLAPHGGEVIQFPPEMDENWLRNGLVN